MKPIESVFSDYPEICLDGEQQRLYLNGVRLDAKRLHGDFGEGIFRVYGNEFIGLARIAGGELISVKRLNGD